MDDDEIIKQAQEICVNECDVLKIFPLLTSIAEKRGAMAVEERARFDHKNDKYTVAIWEKLPEFIKDDWRKKARKSLGVESSAWHKIGADEKEAIEFGITMIDSPEYEGSVEEEKALRVLRCLIGDDE